MRKVVKRILLALGGIVLLLVMAAVVILVVVDPNDYRDEIANAAYKATGRHVELNGPISLKIFPRLAVSAADVKLDAAPGFGEAPLLSVRELSLRMAILPLLTGRVQVDSVLLDGFSVTLVTDKNGHNNWDVPGSSEAAATETTPEDTPKDEQQLTPEEAEKRINALLESNITAIIISDCQISYINQIAGQDYFLQLARLELDNVGLDRDVACLLELTAEDRKAGLKAGLALNGIVKYMLREQNIIYDLEQVTLNGTLPQLEGTQTINGAFKGTFNLADLGGALNASVKHDALVLGLNTDFGLKPSVKANGELSLDANPAALMRALKIQNAPDSEALDRLTGGGKFTFADNLITVNGLTLSLGRHDLDIKLPVLKAKLEANGPLPVSMLNLELQAEGVPASLAGLAGMELQGRSEEIPANLSAGLTARLDGRELKIDDVKLLLDKDTLSLTVPNLTARLNTSRGAAFPLASLAAELNVTSRPRALTNLFGMKLETADPKALNDFSAAMGVSLNNFNLAVNNVQARLDSTTLTGGLSAMLPGSSSLPKGSIASVKSNLQLGVLDLDRYLAPAREGAEEKQAEEPENSASSKPQTARGPLQDSPLARLYADLTLAMQKLTVQKVDIEKILLIINLNQGVVSMSKGELAVFDGVLDSTARAALAQPVPDLSVSAKLQKLDVAKTLTALADENRLGGKAEADIDVSFKGLDSDSILRTLGGRGKLKLKEGALRGMALIPAGAETALGKYSKNLYEFDEMDASFTFIDGKLVNDHVNVNAKSVGVFGTGSIILSTTELDYKGIIRGVDGNELPILAGGPLKKLWVKVDTEELAKMAVRKATEKARAEMQEQADAAKRKLDDKAEAAKQKLDEKVEKEKERITGKVNNEIQRGLGKLFK